MKNASAPQWWTVILLVVDRGVLVRDRDAFSTGPFRSYVPVTLTSDRAGLVMETGAKVKLRGVQVGRVGTSRAAASRSSFEAGDRPRSGQIHPGQRGRPRSGPPPRSARSSSTWCIRRTPARNGWPPARCCGPRTSPPRSTPSSRTSSTAQQDRPGQAQRGADRGGRRRARPRTERIGEATTDANQVLLALNPRSDTIRRTGARSRGSTTPTRRRPDIVAILNAASTTSTTISHHRNGSGCVAAQHHWLLEHAASICSARARTIWSQRINTLEPTTDLLLKYNPEYTCIAAGREVVPRSRGLSSSAAATGKSPILDTALLLGNDPYQLPRQPADRRGQGRSGR